MRKILIWIDRLGKGVVVTIIFLFGFLPLALETTGITFFPFITDVVFRQSLMASLTFFIWSVGGIVLLIRNEKGVIGTIMSVIGFFITIATLYVALSLIFRF